AADPQASFPEADQQAQARDDRFDKVEKDLTRLTLIVEQMLKASSPNAQETTPQEQPVPMPPNTPATQLDPIPPGPIPASARIFAPRRLSPVPTLAVPPVEATASR
ncbi:MAG: hypothetical protein H7062_15800, partial [Candidatus Saccharimonas sp.]|nr:hypothetical protein [Planctomycetaceae bacterium]